MDFLTRVARLYEAIHQVPIPADENALIVVSDMIARSDWPAGITIRGADLSLGNHTYQSFALIPGLEQAIDELLAQTGEDEEDYFIRPPFASRPEYTGNNFTAFMTSLIPTLQEVQQLYTNAANMAAATGQPRPPTPPIQIPVAGPGPQPRHQQQQPVINATPALNPIASSIALTLPDEYIYNHGARVSIITLANERWTAKEVVPDQRPTVVPRYEFYTTTTQSSLPLTDQGLLTTLGQHLLSLDNLDAYLELVYTIFSQLRTRTWYIPSGGRALRQCTPAEFVFTTETKALSYFLRAVMLAGPFNKDRTLTVNELSYVSSVINSHMSGNVVTGQVYEYECSINVNSLEYNVSIGQLKLLLSSIPWPFVWWNYFNHSCSELELAYIKLFSLYFVMATGASSCRTDKPQSADDAIVPYQSFKGIKGQVTQMEVLAELQRIQEHQVGFNQSGFTHHVYLFPAYSRQSLEQTAVFNKFVSPLTASFTQVLLCILLTDAAVR